ncbi:methyltransferase, FkbM family protein [Tritrichomonas foetus]|uniref:Methyltransferase, FkbM family protein n=1 Tax=Tritrichomonas foetus TaxID=1144522 RepID=A0A1J4J7R6_9EUKA|nr:methyltransferase, FkbM family protein [Tritrichomonas foetus]|eukprot:OHS93699.1 methyltransferase, FkbM family protein [Tritrichomonas foetus]
MKTFTDINKVKVTELRSYPKYHKKDTSYLEMNTKYYLSLNIFMYITFIVFLLLQRQENNCQPFLHNSDENTPIQHLSTSRKSRSQSNLLHKSFDERVNDIFPKEVPLPTYSCHGQPYKKRDIHISESPDIKFGGNATKQLEYAYKEMNANIPYLVRSGRSLTTFLHLLNTIDLSLRCGYFYVPYTTYQDIDRKEWVSELQEIKKKYKIRDIFPEVFFYHHGLRFADPRIQNYVRNRNIIDMGAYIGDSALVFFPYTDEKVYSYEYSLKNVKEMEKTFRENNIPSDKYLIINAGISNESAVVMIEDDSGISSGNKIKINGGKVQINMTTIDDEAKKYKMKVGMIKGDIEGFELKALEGAKETLKRDRPIISVSLYHHWDEFFGIPKLVRELENYEFEFSVGTWSNNFGLNELILFGYPKEILDN